MAGKNSSLPPVTILSNTYNHFLSQFEIDTVRLFIPNYELSDKHLKYLLGLINVQQNAGTSKGTYRGTYKGFRIRIKYNTHLNKHLCRITITGSLSNYFMGYEKSLPYSQIREAVNKLSNELRLNLDEAFLYRVDVNLTFKTDEKVSKYTHHLFTDLSRFKRFEKDDGVIFQTKSKALVFYNKSKQLRDIKEIEVENLYRIEFRILRGVKKEIGVEKLKDLYSIENYFKLLDLFCKYMNQVKLQYIPKEIKSFKGVKSFIGYIMLKGIEAIGYSEIYKFIEQLSNEKVFSYANQKYRLRRKITELLSNKQLNRINPLAEEVIQKFLAEYKKETG